MTFLNKILYLCRVKIDVKISRFLVCSNPLIKDSPDYVFSTRTPLLLVRMSDLVTVYNPEKIEGDRLKKYLTEITEWYKHAKGQGK